MLQMAAGHSFANTGPNKIGKTIDLKLSEKRDKKAAFSFFQKCIGQNSLSEKRTMDKSVANKAGADLVNFT